MICLIFFPRQCDFVEIKTVFLVVDRWREEAYIYVNDHNMAWEYEVVQANL